MSNVQFIKALLVSLIICVVLLGLTHFIRDISQHFGFVIFSLAFFVIFSTIIFSLARGRQSNGSGDRFLFIVVINVFVKLIAAFLIVFSYVKYGDPTNKLFVIPFLEIYLVFTVLETWYLSKLARAS